MANEYMMVSSVTNVLSQATDWLIDLGENWIDAQLDDGLLKEIFIKNSIFRNSLIFQGLPPIKYQNLMYFPLFLPL